MTKILNITLFFLFIALFVSVMYLTFSVINQSNVVNHTPEIGVGIKEKIQ